MKTIFTLAFILIASVSAHAQGKCVATVSELVRAMEVEDNYTFDPDMSLEAYGYPGPAMMLVIPEINHYYASIGCQVDLKKARARGLNCDSLRCLINNQAIQFLK